MKLGQIVMGLVVLLFCQIAGANNNFLPGDKQGQIIQDYLSNDSNKDKVVTRSERNNTKKSDFVKADRDRNGVVTWSEYKTFRLDKQRVYLLNMASLADTNKDGFLSMGEFLDKFLVADNSNKVATIFLLTDSNGDSLLSKNELLYAFAYQPSDTMMWDFADLDANSDTKLIYNEFMGNTPVPQPPRLLN